MSELPMMLQNNLKHAAVEYNCPEADVLSFAVAADFLEEHRVGSEHVLRVLRHFYQELAGQAPHNEWIGWGSAGPYVRMHAFYRQTTSLCGRESLQAVHSRLILNPQEPGWRWCRRCVEVLRFDRRRSVRRYSLLGPSYEQARAGAASYEQARAEAASTRRPSRRVDPGEVWLEDRP